MLCCCSIQQSNALLLRTRLGERPYRDLQAALAAFSATGAPGAKSGTTSIPYPGGAHVNAPGDGVDVLFDNGTILTMTDAVPEVEALCIHAGKIVYVGDRAGARALAGPKTQFIDLNGRLLMPGFIEPHMHILPTIGAFDWLDLSVASIQPYTFENILTAIRQATPIDNWILGKGFDPSQLDPWQDLTVDILDPITSGHPAFITNQSGHIAYTNSRALQIAGVTDDTPNPPQGKIARFASTQRLSGILVELSAFALVAKHLPKLAEAESLLHIRRIFDQAARVGNTMLFDAGIGMALGAEAEILLMDGLVNLLDTPVRVGGALYFNQTHLDAVLLQLALLKPRLDKNRFRYSAVKLFADGSNQGLTGLQTYPYEQAVLDRTIETYVGQDICGWQDASMEEMTRIIEAANAHGWQVAIHANGQQAIANALLAYAEGLKGMSGRERRHRMEHASLLTDADIAKLAELGITPTFLIGHVPYWGRVLRDNILGYERAHLLDRCQSAYHAGLDISMHCDLAVTPLGPLCEIEHAVTRIMQGTGGEVLNADERISVDLALKAQTRHAAWVCHADDIVGTLEIDKLADLVILEQDPRSVPSTTISQIRVSETWSDGRRVYSNETGEVSGCGVGFL